MPKEEPKNPQNTTQIPDVPKEEPIPLMNTTQIPDIPKGDHTTNEAS